ncbi:hypothetical protein CBR_g26326 [Chara braunii]|uniref:Uncharacterized protein n=1 Tax=Chara braunii TaxID=69332 RepID=A0A388L7L7_CHABU|nr:hypothetical protein CBR_g26326 [Chara braunii]|eukprot:GBG78296.1 hypothetical protein CBR_g26326 [Chara braunii]
MMESTPGGVGGGGSGRSPPVAPQAEIDYWEDEDRIRELLQMCFDEGVYPTEIDPGEMTIDRREVRFKLNTSLDEIEVKWLKERTVSVIYKDAARFLPKNIKDDLVRAFEDGWVLGNERLGGNMRRGRVKIEGPGVASYVAKASEVARFMIEEGQVEVTLGAETYKILFKPWMTRAEFRELRRQEDDRVFWVTAIQIPLDAMPFIYAQIEKAIGKIILAHPADADPARPALVNARFDLDPDSRPNMKDVIWIETSKGDTLEVRLASTDTLRCRKCRQFFHTEDDCRRGTRSRNQGLGERASNPANQAPSWQQHPTASQTGGGQSQGTYQGVLRPTSSQSRQQGSEFQGGVLRNNPTFSPGGGGGGGGGQLGYMGNSALGQLQAQGGSGVGGPYLNNIPTQGIAPGNWAQAAGTQAAGMTLDWYLANGYVPGLWPVAGQVFGNPGRGGPGYIPGSFGGQSVAPTGQVGVAGLIPPGNQVTGLGVTSGPCQGGVGTGMVGTLGMNGHLQGNSGIGTGTGAGNPLGGTPRGGGAVGGTLGEQEAASTPNRSRGRGLGKQRRLSMSSHPEVTPENSRGSRISRDDSEKSVGHDVGIVTPGNKTTRDRRLVSAARTQGTEMPQYLLPLLCTEVRNAK